MRCARRANRAAARVGQDAAFRAPDPREQPCVMPYDVPLAIASGVISRNMRRAPPARMRKEQRVPPRILLAARSLRAHPLNAVC